MNIDLRCTVGHYVFGQPRWLTNIRPGRDSNPVGPTSEFRATTGSNEEPSGPTITCGSAENMI